MSDKLVAACILGERQVDLYAQQYLEALLPILAATQTHGGSTGVLQTHG